MGSLWTYQYKENIIVVKNQKASELHVNSRLIDKAKGIHLKVELHGKLESGEEIRAILGGLLDVKCSLYVDNIQLEPLEIK